MLRATLFYFYRNNSAIFFDFIGIRGAKSATLSE